MIDRYKYILIEIFIMYSNDPKGDRSNLGEQNRIYIFMFL